jgi:hypothetical protein
MIWVIALLWWQGATECLGAGVALKEGSASGFVVRALFAAANVASAVHLGRLAQ